MSEFHAVVWLDHQEARVFHFNTQDADKTVVHPDQPKHQLHHKKGSVGKSPEDQHYYHEVVEKLTGAQEILIIGPGQAKLELFKHIQHHDKAFADKVVAVETSDHPSDGQILNYARKYFRAADRMLPQL